MAEEMENFCPNCRCESGWHDGMLTAQKAVIRAAWLDSAPGDVRDLPSWLADRPSTILLSADGRGTEPYGFILPGERGGATDGHGALIVERAASDHLAGFTVWDIDEAQRKVDSVLDLSGAPTGYISTWMLRAAIDEAGHRGSVLIRDVRLDARLLSAWVLPAAEAAGDDTIAIALKGPRDQASWAGNRWAACTMPRLERDEKTVRLPLVEAERGQG